LPLKQIGIDTHRLFVKTSMLGWAEGNARGHRLLSQCMRDCTSMKKECETRKKEKTKSRARTNTKGAIQPIHVRHASAVTHRVKAEFA
jgi:hypothetical protein